MKKSSFLHFSAQGLPDSPRKLNYPRYPWRPSKEKPDMTIAAGFVCTDGLVLCSDTLLSANYRRQGEKLWAWNDDQVSVAVTGAGDYVLLKLAKEAIFRHLSTLRRKPQQKFTGSVKHQAIEPAIASIHSDHVDKASDWDRSNGYMLSLLVGVREGSRTTLFETNRTACSQVPNSTCVGSGAPVGNYVASTLFSSSLPVAWGAVVAAYLIQQSKAYGEDCGGDTNITIIRNDGSFEELAPEKIHHSEAAANRIHEALGKVLFTAADPTAIGIYKEAVKAFELAMDGSRNAVLMDDWYFSMLREQSRAEVPPAPKSPKRGRKRPPASRA